jgi:hypothetical protein
MRLSGRMVERLHERQARRTLDLAEAIAAMEAETKPAVQPKAPRAMAPRPRPEG